VTYGENAGRLRAELGGLLRQHRVQQRLGGSGSHSVPLTTTTEERAELGRQIRRFRQSALVWCSEAANAVLPITSHPNSRTPDPFRVTADGMGPLIALQRSLDQSIRRSTAPLPGLAELTTPHATPMVEHWRQVARAAALGEHDLDAGFGTGRLTAPQRHTIVSDVAAITQALIVLDRRYARVPGWEAIHNAPRLGWAALACALNTGHGDSDLTVDLHGWKPPAKLIPGPARPGLAGVLQAEHNLVVHMREFPSAISLRLVVDSQQHLSERLSKLAVVVDGGLADRWAVRSAILAALRLQLRDLAGLVGKGGEAAAESANALSRLRAMPHGRAPDGRVLHAMDALFTSLDSRLADVIQVGVTQRAYVICLAPSSRLELRDGKFVEPEARFLPSTGAAVARTVELARALRPPDFACPLIAGTDRGRAELHAAMVHVPHHWNQSISM
jgi:hypothetical protein